MKITLFPENIHKPCTVSLEEFDIHSVTPNEMEQLTLIFYNAGILSLDERKHFMSKLPLREIDESEYDTFMYLFRKPDKKLDLWKESFCILKEQLNENAPPELIMETLAIIRILKKIVKRKNKTNGDKTIAI